MDAYAMYDNTKTDLMGLTARDRAIAYAAAKERFGLKAAQRDKLDCSTAYTMIMFFAHNQKWDHVQTFLANEGII